MVCNVSSQCGSRPSDRHSLTWECIRKETSQASSQTFRMRNPRDGAQQSILTTWPDGVKFEDHWFVGKTYIYRGRKLGWRGRLYYLPWKKSESESCSVMSDSLWPHGLYSPWNSPGQNTEAGSLSLLQGVFPSQGLSPGLMHYRRILYHLSHKESSRKLEWVAYLFSSRSSWARNWTRVSCIAGRFFTN